jgi:tetratricopeptide (TPR) repeat protein
MTNKNQAIQTALKGNWEEAITLNKALIEEDPKDIDALNRLALAYSIVGKIKDAKTTYQKVIQLDALNAIALRNLKKLKEANGQVTNGNLTKLINNKFLEEPGKTKVVDLVNIAQPQIIENLRTGESLDLSIKRLKIFVSDGKQYIGVLPDDIARRLIKFMKAGCLYDAYVKSSSTHKVSLFIKEVKKTSRLKDQPSFTSFSESHLEIEKHSKVKHKIGKEELKNEEEETDYLEEE